MKTVEGVAIDGVYLKQGENPSSIPSGGRILRGLKRRNPRGAREMEQNVRRFGY